MIESDFNAGARRFMYASGAMVMFGRMFRELAEKETRVITTMDDPKLGKESYALVESYCVAPDCDCRRVMINVIRDRDTRHLATINWAFDEDDEDRGPFLDPLNTQSELSDDLLKMVSEVVLVDKAYIARLERHYRMVKRAVADPNHEVHEKLKGVSQAGEETDKKLKDRFLAAMTEAELVAVWRKVGLNVPKELVEETLKRGERMVSQLGSLLTDEDLWAQPPESRSGWAPAHALKLLNAIGSPSAAPYVAEFFRWGLGEDWLTDEGDNLVLSLGPQGIDPMLEVFEDPSANLWGRVIAVDGLAMLGLAHPSERDRLIFRLRQFAKPLMDKPSDEVTDDEGQLLLTLLEALATLHDEPAREWIERAARQKRCTIHADDVRESLNQFETPCEEILEDLRTDPLDHFTPENLLRFKDMYGLRGEDSPPRPSVRETRKVGRNDPCPCGSGKKFKKCCLPG